MYAFGLEQRYQDSQAACLPELNSGCKQGYLTHCQRLGATKGGASRLGYKNCSRTKYCKDKTELDPMYCRGVRGATTVETNDREEILGATRELLALIIRQNGIKKADVASAQFSTTKDLDAEFPALAARQIGWSDVPLLCGHEMQVPGSLDKCIRILIHWNTEKTQQEIHHIYHRGAERLRPDLCEVPPVDLAELEAWIDEKMRANQ